MTATPRADTGAAMVSLMERLFPICRSMTGDGVRETLAVLAERIPLEIREVPSGTPVLDWTIPPEWKIRDAWIKTIDGERVVDFRESNLHVVGNSVPVAGRMSMAELRGHLHSIPEQPDWIPYRTAFHTEGWGFCLSQRQLDGLTDSEYDVCIDATLEPGHLTFGEYYLAGQTPDEVLFTTHTCHPSLCNDNLSGIVLSTFLADSLSRRDHRYSYRFLFIPATIGSITWLALNRDAVGVVRHGLSLANLGDARGFTYKRTEAGDAEIDRAAAHVLGHREGDHALVDFYPYGYDERQFNSPGFRLPVGSLMRGRHGGFPEYHTSADDLDFVSAGQLEEAFEVLTEIVDVLEGNLRYRSLSPYGEPQLGRRGIYETTGSGHLPGIQMAMLWVLNQSDGSRSLLDIADRSGMPFAVIREAATVLAEHSLLEAARE